MYVTGRLPLLIALGAVPVVLVSLAGVDAWAAAAGWIVLCAIHPAAAAHASTRASETSTTGTAPSATSRGRRPVTYMSA